MHYYVKFIWTAILCTCDIFTSEINTIIIIIIITLSTREMICGVPVSEFTVRRKDENGGDVTYSDFKTLQSAFAKMVCSPQLSSLHVCETWFICK